MTRGVSDSSPVSPSSSAPGRQAQHHDARHALSARVRALCGDLKGKRVVVVGLGRSGVAAARLALKKGAHVVANDSRAAVPGADDIRATAEKGRSGAAVTWVLGHHPEDLAKGADLVVVSPGVGALEPVVRAEAAGVPVVGELAFAAQFVSGKIIAITGTNGKSTTTTLCGSMLQQGGRATFVGGNLGIPLAEAVVDGLLESAHRPVDHFVLECSSFQLERCAGFRPDVAVVLNISPDHLDRHGTLEAYAAAKAEVLGEQTAEDVAVLNWDDPIVRKMGSGNPAHAATTAWFSLTDPNQTDVTGPETLAGRLVQARSQQKPQESPSPSFHLNPGNIRLPATSKTLVGRHNQENALAALVAARAVGVPEDALMRAMAGFTPLRHRMSFVATMNGVRFFDDSKATNVGAAVAALNGFPQPVVLVAGGRGKGASYTPLADVMSRHGRGVVLMGEAAQDMAEEMSAVFKAHDTKHVDISLADDMEEAVRLAMAKAEPGDAVVLSPACASFDMFKSYEERGIAFANAVFKLGEST